MSYTCRNPMICGSSRNPFSCTCGLAPAPDVTYGALAGQVADAHSEIDDLRGVLAATHATNANLRAECTKLQEQVVKRFQSLVIPDTAIPDTAVLTAAIKGINDEIDNLRIRDDQVIDAAVDRLVAALTPLVADYRALQSKFSILLASVRSAAELAEAK